MITFFSEHSLPVLYTIDSRWKGVIPEIYYEEIISSLFDPPLFLILPDDDYYNERKRYDLETEYSLLFPSFKIIFITSDQEQKFLRKF